MKFDSSPPKFEYFDTSRPRNPLSYLSVPKSVCLYVHLYVYLLCLFLSLFVCLPSCLSVHLSVRLSVHLSDCTSLHLLVRLSVHLYVCISYLRAAASGLKRTGPSTFYVFNISIIYKIQNIFTYFQIDFFFFVRP